jgi:DNA repair protein RecO (recombination protein O)
VPYGDTSLVVTGFSRAFGLQGYMVKGARSIGKKGQSLRPYLQPGAMLEVVVYHHPSNQLQYIREMRWAKVYQNVLTSVVHNAVAIFMIELVTKCISQSEPNEPLFEEIAQYLTLLDEAESGVIANLPLHFALFLASELGFRPENNFSAETPFFNLKDGNFSDIYVNPEISLDGVCARLLHELLKIDQPVTLYRLKANRQERQELLRAFERYFDIHTPGFGHMRSLGVLTELF